MADKEVGEALETIARDLSYRFPISTLDAYEQICGNMRALEDAIEQSAILGVTPQVMMLRFIRGGIQGTRTELDDD